ncbi:class I SAM-dependent methyltransferase [Salegentibacter sp. JZCK2]|uniref:class I SAM-dependent methyltransferase n=1 Tax=Salegentibacter tibetensis TaxID=2873600 RepID=UPI001CCDEF38|nr:class I SAM-dependent methyltransferase [Salegentibacter tibetensis]MBZ9729649.1 class I SAM-dependent methyltransferase [Salegentibacter tibetensis]
MNKALLNPEVQEFLRKHLKATPAELALRGSPFPNISSSELAQQLTGLQKAEKKLPTWFKQTRIYYPPKLNLEQTSSETTAKYKASLLKGETLIDLTGGLGIDDYYFAENFKEVIHCELNAELSEIAAHNLKQLGVKNISFRNEDSIAFLKDTDQRFDCIYIDPARRDDSGGKVFKLADCLPNVPENIELLFRKSKTILIKTSPLLDLQAGISELKFVAEIHIIAVNNDVKELLWMLKKDNTSATKIKTRNFTKTGLEEFEGIFNKTTSELNYSLPKNFLYEPNAAIMKSGLFEEIAHQTQTEKLHPNSHLYTSEKEINFPGRRFKIIDNQEYKPSSLKKKFKNLKANITTRNFHESVAVLRKKFKIKEGGKTYLFFTTNINNEKIVLFCEKC